MGWVHQTKIRRHDAGELREDNLAKFTHMWQTARHCMQNDELDEMISNLWDRWNFENGDPQEKLLLDYLCEYRAKSHMLIGKRPW